jgi:hypothetical protein
VEWSDGDTAYFWRDIEAPEWLITEPQRITLDAIGSTRNAKLRRCLIERFGQERFLHESGAERIGGRGAFRVSKYCWGMLTSLVRLDDIREP